MANILHWNFRFALANAQTIPILQGSSVLPFAVITGWFSNVRLMKPKSLNKEEQICLENAVKESSISMTILWDEIHELISPEVSVYSKRGVESAIVTNTGRNLV